MKNISTIILIICCVSAWILHFLNNEKKNEEIKALYEFIEADRDLIEEMRILDRKCDSINILRIQIIESLEKCDEE